MKFYYSALFCASFWVTGVTGQAKWKMQAIPVKTRWADSVTPQNVLSFYPRPQMKRTGWTNLNGLWDYAITAKDRPIPTQYQGRILVPFPLESALSGVMSHLQPSENLWYHRVLTNPIGTQNRKVLLHFGAVDWQATVYINGKEIGVHRGGYTSFTFDITDKLHAGNNDLAVEVYDPTDQGIGPHGKQVLNPENIYYTASSGIWQTVWIETVPVPYIKEILLTPDIDLQILHATIDAPLGYTAELIASDAEAPICVVKFATNGHTNIDLPIRSPHLWHPGDPFLYNLDVKLLKGSKVIDEVKSYFAMRKISIAKDSLGFERICLNNQPYYNLGALDQGFWPDGLYTAPTDEALAFDIKAIKAMGFNTIRKHIKVEPDRWYYYADSIGMLVWQDMVNPNQALPEGSKPEFERESAEIVRQLYNHPAITTWVLFNERWGQYDQQRLTQWIKKADPSRMVNGHTGELLYVNDQLRAPADSPYINADMTDVHSYPDPMMPIRQPGKAQVIGEFGGIGVFVADHQWNSASAWGYINERSAGLAAKYRIMNEHLELLERQGLGGSIYTQPYDVEGEQNGLMTYDREIIKIPLDTLRAIHAHLNFDIGARPLVSIGNADVTDQVESYAKLFQQYIDGSRGSDFLLKLAVMAVQVGDKVGAREVGAAYIITLNRPINVEDIHFALQFTKSTKDPGFEFILKNADDFKHVIGSREFDVAIMNMIFIGDIEPMLNSTTHPNWDGIEQKIKHYGEPGEEIFLRAKTVALYNQNNWHEYIPVASKYLSRFGQNLSTAEREMFQDAINKNK